MTDTLQTSTKKNSQKASFPETYRGEAWALLKLGGPMAAAQVIQFMVYAIDAMMIGRLGEIDLAASSLGITLFFVVWMVGSGAVMVVSPMTSQALGANQNNYRDVRITVRMSFWIVLALTPLSVIFALFSESLMLALGQDPEVSAKAADYLLALCAGLPFALSIMAMRNFLMAIERTWIPLVLAAVITLLNAGLNYLLIYGNWGFPAWGLVGAGVASSLAYMASFGLFVAYCYIDKRAKRFRIMRRVWRPQWGRFTELVRLGLPMSITTLFEGMLFNAAVFIAGVIGTTEQAAYHVGLNIAAMCFMLPYGFSMAGSVRVGLAAGAGDIKALKRVSIVTLITCMFLMWIFAMIVVAMPYRIAALYMDISDPANAAVIAMTATFLPIAAAFMLFDAVQVVANQLLRGIKDVTAPMIITGISYWVVGFPVAFYLGLYTSHSAKGIWYGLLAGLFCASVLLGGRYYVKIWGKKGIKL